MQPLSQQLGTGSARGAASKCRTVAARAWPQLCSQAGNLRRCRPWTPSSRQQRQQQQRGARIRLQAAAVDVDDATLTYAGESFYTLLGVSPDASPREIKAAYYGMMRECHPDRSMGDESTEFCAMLNDIYETLMDADRRAMYDELAGFSDEAVNPFLDTSHERDLVFVDEFTCIGCRNCNNVCSRTFEMEEDWGRARAMRQGVDTPMKLQEAIDTCPVSCIHWVTAPQLSLLEAAMARMERVAVWSMMTGNGANRDVFTEASLAWEKRFARSQARKAAAVAAAARAQWEAEEGMAGAQPGGEEQQGSWGGFWSRMRTNAASYQGATGSQFYERTQSASAKARAQAAAGATGSGAGAVPESKDARSIASLAARAARASRSWKVYQEVVRSRRGLMSLSSTSSAEDL